MWYIVIVVGVVLLGFSRVASEGPPDRPLGLQKSVSVARCLGSHGEIAANTPITLLTLPHADIDAIVPPPIQDLQFVATGPVQIEIPDLALRTSVESGKADTLSAGTMLSLSESNGAFEFRTESGTAEVRRPKSRFFLEVDEPVHFGPADDASYAVEFGGVKIERKIESDKPIKTVLPAGTKGTLHIGGGSTLLTLQALSASPWPLNVASTLVPVRAVGQTGLANLTIEARQPGLRFETAGLMLAACARSADDKLWQPVGVAETKARELGAATVTLTLPSDLLPLKPIRSIVELAVATTDGQYIGYGGFTVISRIWAGVLATALAGGLFWRLSTTRHEQRRREVNVLRGKLRGATLLDQRKENSTRTQLFSALFIDQDNEPSLALFQIFIWTFITIWGLLYVFIVTGNLLSLTSEMMVLLGIAGTGSVLSRWISASGGAAPQGAPAVQDDKPAPFEFWQILSTEGKFDLLKLQLFVFTLTIAVYVVWRITDTAAFPVLDGNTLLLL